ncbi:MAG: DUF5683 domain-containing protein [Candidatus Krumholzibacteriia bacterium]
MMRTMGTGRNAAAASALALALTLVVPGAAVAGGDPGFLRTEREVTGSSLSGSWRNLDLGGVRAVGQIGGQGLDRRPPEVGGGAASDRPGEVQDDGPSVSGAKIKAGALSLLLPGAGQYYNGDRGKAYVMAGIEAGIWTAFFVFDQQGNNRMESSREYAAIYAGAAGGHPESWWQAVGKYMDSDQYEDFLRREARATGEPLPPPLPGSDNWQWVNDDRKYEYQVLRADANNAHDRRDFMILFAVVNRAVAVYDAVKGAGDRPGTLEAEVLGLDLNLGVVPSWRDPGARCTFARSF